MSLLTVFETIVKDVEEVPGEIKSFLTVHQTQIHTALVDAQTVATAGIGIAGGLGAAGVVSEIAKVSNGLTMVGAAAATGATNTSLNQQVATLAGLVNGLVTSGVVGVKSASAQAAVTNAVNAVVSKAQTVIGTLATAAAALAPTQGVA